MCCCTLKHHSQVRVGLVHHQSCCCHGSGEDNLDQLRRYRQGLENELASVKDRITELEHQA